MVLYIDCEKWSDFHVHIAFSVHVPWTRGNPVKNFSFEDPTCAFGDYEALHPSSGRWRERARQKMSNICWCCFVVVEDYINQEVEEEKMENSQTKKIPKYHTKSILVFYICNIIHYIRIFQLKLQLLLLWHYFFSPLSITRMFLIPIFHHISFSFLLVINCS